MYIIRVRNTGSIESFSRLAHVIRTEAPRIESGPEGGVVGTRIVCVDGHSGSGKTTFAARLAAHLYAPTVHMDDLYPGWDGLADSTARLVEWVLDPLYRGRPAQYRRYDWDAGRYAEWNEVPVAETVVVEGVGSGGSADYPAFVVWVEAPWELRMERGIERDGEAFRPYWERWAVQEDAMFAKTRTRQRADILVNGSPETPHAPDKEFVTLPE